MIILNCETADGKGIKILIVEDNETFRQSFKESLQMLCPSLNIQEVEDGNKCLKKVDSFHPQLVFMDIRLPGENGLSLTKKIKAKHPETRVIVITSYDNPEYRDAAAKNGASGFFSKDSLGLTEIKGLLKSVSPCS